MSGQTFQCFLNWPLVIRTQQERPYSHPYPWSRSWLVTPGYWISPGGTCSRDLGCQLLAQSCPGGSPGLPGWWQESEDWGVGMACWASGWNTAGSDLVHSDSSYKQQGVGEKTRMSFTEMKNICYCLLDFPLPASGILMPLTWCIYTVLPLPNSSTHPSVPITVLLLGMTFLFFWLMRFPFECLAKT